MADAEISILIQAQDKISAQLSDIEKTINKFGDENAKATQRMSQGWEKGTNSLLALGNVASSVDNIFSSITSLEIRLENATERLANAQDRLTDTQKNSKKAVEELSKLENIRNFVLKNHLEKTEFGTRVMDAYNSALEKVADTQLQEERATRQLTIAENGLARAQNQVIGTYIGIGIQSVSLLKSLPVLISSMGGFGLAIAGVSAAMALTAFVMKDNVEVQDTLKKAWEDIKTAIQPVLEALTELIVALWPVLKPILLLAIDIFVGIAKAIAEVVGWITSLIDLIKDLINWLGKITFGPLEKARSIAGQGSILGGNVKKVNDAIIRPNGQVIETDPRDTIIATKNPGGITVYIDSIYGMDPSQISKALKRELSTKISI